MKKIQIKLPVSNALLTALGLAVSLQPLALSAAVLEEIIVTAQKRQESAQDIPLVINTLSEDALKKSGVATVADLQLTIPGFVFQRNIAQSSPFLRGVGSEVSSVGTESSVATHIDGVYIARPSAALADLYDVSRVEVLKGPQGTLYGRNATGGVVNIVTHRPELGETGGKVAVTLGNEGIRKLEGVFNLSLSDKAAYRLSAYTYDNDGFAKNIYLDEAIDTTDTFNVRHQFTYEASDKLTIRLFASDFDAERGTGTIYEDIDYSCCTITDIDQLIVDDDPRTAIQNVTDSVTFEGESYGAEISWDLGSVLVNSITAINKTEYELVSDFDGTNINIFGPFGQQEVSDAFSQELQFFSNSDGNLQWTAGLYYFEEEAQTDFFSTSPTISGIVGGSFNQDSGAYRLGKVDTTAFAVFGQADYHVTDALKLTVGLRYSKEEKDMTTQNFAKALPTGATSATITLDQARSFPNRGAATSPLNPLKIDTDAVTPRFVVSYDTGANTMLWVSATKGFKSGGANIRNSTPLIVDEEILWSYEAGVKSTLLEGAMLFNLTAYYYDFQDIQLNITNPGAGSSLRDLRNAGDVEHKGLELELDYLATDNVRFYGNFAYQQAEFSTDYLANHPNGGVVNINGNQLPRAPEINYTIGAEYSWETKGVGSFEAHIDYAYRSEIYFDIFDDFDSLREDDFGITNFRLNYEPEQDTNWSAALWVKNATDEVYKVNKIFFRGTFEMVGEPRTYGVDFQYNF